MCHTVEINDDLNLFLIVFYYNKLDNYHNDVAIKSIYCKFLLINVIYLSTFTYE